MALASSRPCAWLSAPLLCGSATRQLTAARPWQHERLTRRTTAVCANVATGPEGDDRPDLSASFRAELKKRDIASAAAAEVEHSQEFDGLALLQAIQDKYDRSYDVSLVKREYLGRSFVAMNIMWAYAEQKSFQLTDEEHMDRLEYVAAALRQWGVVGHVKQSISSQKNRPRVGKAISIILPDHLDEAAVANWLA